MQYKPDIQSIWGTLRHYSWRNIEEDGYRARWYRSPNPWKALFSSNLSFPRKASIYFNENLYGWGIEDWEFCYSLYGKGFRSIFDTSICSYHIELPGRIFNAFARNRHEEIVSFARNLLIFLDSNKDDKTLESCAIGLQRLQLNKRDNKWHYKDGPPLRSYRAGIALFRKWFRENGGYSTAEALSGRLARKEISVVVSNYRQSHLWRFLLFALENQTSDPGFELIISDDGSPGSEFLNHRSALQDSYLSVRYIWQLKQGWCVARARNNGIKLARSTRMIFLDGDIIPEEDFLQKHLSYLKRHGKVVVAGNRKLIDFNALKSIRLKSPNFLDNSGVPLYRTKPKRDSGAL